MVKLRHPEGPPRGGGSEGPCVSTAYPKLLIEKELNRMRTLFALLLAVFVFGIASFVQAPKNAAPQAQQPQPPPTIASAMDREISTVEKEITEAAEAMPEAKFNFSPESLNIPGSEYK